MLGGGEKRGPSEKPQDLVTSRDLWCLPAWLFDKWPQIWMCCWHHAHRRTQSFGRPGKCGEKKIRRFINLEVRKEANFGGGHVPLICNIHTRRGRERVRSEADGQDATPKVSAGSQHHSASPSSGQTSGLPFQSHLDMPAKAQAQRESSRTQGINCTPVFYLWCKKWSQDPKTGQWGWRQLLFHP